MLKTVWNAYISAWSNSRGIKKYLFCFANYTFLFLILRYVAFISFAAQARSFVWYIDGVSQHLPRLIYISQTIRNTLRELVHGFSFPLYDFRRGLNSQDLQWFTSPEILSGLFSPEKMTTFYQLYIIAIYYLIGISFLLLTLYLDIRSSASITGAISYAFCGFALLGVTKHPFFGFPLIILPLLILGIEKVLRGKNGFLLLFATLISLLTSLYFSCMQAVLCTLYITVRFFDLYQSNKLKNFIKVAKKIMLWVGTAVLLSGFVILPSFQLMLTSGRIGRNVFLYSDWLKYSQNFYERFLSNFLLTAHDSGAGTSWTVLGFSVLSVPSICVMFAKHEKKERTLRIMFIMLTLMLCVPAISYVMSGFNSFANRFSYGYALCVSVIISFVLNDAEKTSTHKLYLACAFLILYIAICLLAINSDNKNTDAIIFLILSVLFILCIRFSNGKRALFSISCIMVTCVSIYFSANMLYSSNGDNRVSEFLADGYEKIEKGQYSSLSRSKIVEGDNSPFFRATGNQLSLAELNSSFYYHINDIAGYPGTGYSEAYTDWLNELEVAHYGQLQHYYGVDSHAALLALTSNKYYAVRQRTGAVVPYGYDQIDSVKNDNEIDAIYKNENWLPIGFTYGEYMLRSKYENLFPLEKQEAQIQAAVIDHPTVSESISEAFILPSYEKIPFTITSWKNISIKDGVLEVKENNAPLVISFNGLPNAETYLRIVGLDLTSGQSTRHWTLTAETENTKGKAVFYADYHIYSHMQHTQLINLGYSESGFNTITITFPQKGTYKLEGLEVYCQPMDHFSEQVAALKEDVLENIKTTGSTLEGTISVSKDKLLCIAIPYFDSWKAYLDGKPVELYRVNTAFMGIEVPAGDHTVLFKYSLPGLTAGMIMSGLGFIALIGVVVYQKKKKK